jgi:hypothetical protein
MTQERDPETGQFKKEEEIDEFAAEMGLTEREPMGKVAATELGISQLGPTAVEPTQAEPEVKVDESQSQETPAEEPKATPTQDTPTETPTEITLEQLDRMDEKAMLEAGVPEKVAKVVTAYRAQIDSNMDVMAQIQFMQAYNKAGADAPVVEQEPKEKETQDSVMIDPSMDPEAYQKAIEDRILARLEKEGKVAPTPKEPNPEQKKKVAEYFGFLSKRHPDFQRLVPVMGAIVQQHPQYDHPKFVLDILNAARQAVKNDPKLIEKLTAKQPVVLGENADEVKAAAESGQKAELDKKKAAANVLADSSSGPSSKEVADAQKAEAAKAAKSAHEGEFQQMLDSSLTNLSEGDKAAYSELKKLNVI